MNSPMDGDTCAWHPERRAGVRCQRCSRVICGDCMHTASVGFHCPECAGPIVAGRAGRPRRRSVGPRGMQSDDGRNATTAIIGLNIAAFLGTLVSGGSLAGGGGNATIDFGLLGYGRVRDGFTIVH
ncbi:MAG: hypothetical protein ISR43_08555, partial [Acidimicrobiia bacterium]|nr:hypothetical protein [Acidimicrobiia bacterium]